MAIRRIVVKDPHGRVIASDEFENVDAHNASASAHPSLRSAISRLQDAVDSLDGGKVADVRVNGISVVSNNEADITIPTTVEELSDSADYARAEDVDSLQQQVASSISDLQDQIDAMVADKTSVSLTASPGSVYVGEQNTIGLTAKVTGVTASSITINKGSEVLATDTDKSTLSYVDTITPNANVSYSAQFVINGVTKTANATVTVVGKIYYGSGTTEVEALTVAPKRTSPSGTYNVTVATTGYYVFFVVPNNMSINSATLSGFEFPLDNPTTTTRDGATYKVYKSSNAVEAGTYEIVIK